MDASLLDAGPPVVGTVRAAAFCEEPDHPELCLSDLSFHSADQIL